VSITGPTFLYSSPTIDSSAGSGGISVVGTVDADITANNRTLSLNSGSTGIISFSGSGAIGSSKPLASLTVTNSGGATFSGAVTVTAGSGAIAVTNTAASQTVVFQGNLSATSMTASLGNAYNLSFTGTTTTVPTVTFSHTGTLTLGGGSSTLTFASGVVHTAGATTVNGTVKTTDTAASFAALTVGGTSTIQTYSSSGGTLTIATLLGNQNLTLTTGSGAITVSGNVGDGTAANDLGTGTGAALTISGTTALADFKGASQTNSGISISGPSKFEANATIGAGDTVSTLSGNVTLVRPSTADLTIAVGRSIIFGGTTTLDGAAAGGVYKINVNTSAASGSNAADIYFTGAILPGTNAQSLNLATSTSTTGSRLVTFNGNATFSSTTPYTTYALQVTANKLAITNGVSVSSTNQDILFYINSALNLGGTSVTVNTGGGNFRIAPVTITNTVEFAPVSTGIGTVFVDSRFSGITTGSGHFYLGQTTQTGNIYIGNSSNAVAAAYLLEVVQSQSGAGNITFYNGYTASNENLILTAGTGGVIFGNTVTPLAISLGTGSFTSNGAVGPAGAVTVAQNTTVSAAGGISFLTQYSTINDSSAGTHTLGLTVGGTPTAGIVLAGTVGATSPIQTLTMSVTGTSYGISMVNVATSSFQSYTASGGITLNGTSYVTSGGSVQFNGAVTLAASPTIDTTDGNVTPAGSTITFNPSLDDSASDTHDLILIQGTGTIQALGVAVGGTHPPKSLTVRADKGLSATAVVKAQSINLYTYSDYYGTATSMGIGASAVGTCQLLSSSLANLQGFTTLTIGESGKQAGTVTVKDAASPVPASAIVVNSNYSTGTVTLDDSSGVALATGGAGNININAGLGGITANATDTTAELSTSGIITLNTTGAIGSSSNRVQFPTGQSNIVVTNAPGGVWLDGIGNITLAAITTASTATTGLNVTTSASNGTITLAGAVSTAGVTAGNGAITLTPNGTGAIVLDYSAGTTISTNAAAVSFNAPVYLEADATILTPTTAGGAIAFSSTIDSYASTSHSLTVGASASHVGAVTISGTIGATTALSALTIYGGAISLVNIGASSSVAGVSGAVLINSSSTITSSMTNWCTGGNQTYVAATSMTWSAITTVNLTTGAGGVIDLSGTQALVAILPTTSVLTSDDINLNTSSTSQTSPINSLDFGTNTLEFFTVTPSENMSIGDNFSAAWALSQWEINRIKNATKIIFGQDTVYYGAITFNNADFSAVNGTGVGAEIEAYSTGNGTGSINLNDGQAGGGSANSSDFGLSAGTAYVALFAGNSSYHGTITSAQLANGYPDILTQGNIYLNASYQIGSATNPVQVWYYNASTPKVYVGYKTDGVTTITPSATNGAWIQGIGGLVLAYTNLSGPLSLTAYTGIGYIVLTDNQVESGDISFNVPVILAASSGSITIDTGGHNIIFNSTIDAESVVNGGVQSLTIVAGAGNVAFNAPIGNNTTVSGLAVNAIKSLTITSATNVTFGNATAGTPNLTTTGDVSITNTSTGVLEIDDSTSSSDTSVFDLKIGGNFSQSGASSVKIAGDIETTSNGTITFNSPLQLNGNVLLYSGSGAVTFQSSATIDKYSGASYSGLYVNSSGVTTFGKAIGSSSAIDSLTMDSTALYPFSHLGGTTRVNGGAISTSGAQIYNDTVVIGADTTFTGAAISFAGTLDGDTAATRNLTVNDSGATTFGGQVGKIQSLRSLTTDSGGSTTISGGAIATSGAQTYNDAVTVGANDTLTGVSISFQSTVDSDAAANARILTIDDGGTTTFTGAVGGSKSLGSLITGSTGSTAINGGAVTTTVAQTYNNNVTLGANTVLTQTGGAATSVSFEKTLDAASAGGQSLTVQAGSGALHFVGAVGGGKAPSTIAATSTNSAANAIELSGSVTTTGAQTYTGNVTVDGGSSDKVLATAALLLFAGPVVHTSGTIQAGINASDVAIRFASSYTASSTASLSGNSTAPGIEFDANATLESFTHNGDTLEFKGTAAQQFDSNDQIIGTVMMAGTDLVITGHSVHQTGGTYTTTIQSGILDLATNGATVGWVADSATGTASSAGLFHGFAGSLILDAGTQLSCVSLWTESIYAISNAGANTITSSGIKVTISGAFSTPANSTLVMTGSGATLTATPQIGNLTVSGSVKLGTALSMVGNMVISGTLDASTSSYQITIAGSSWTNSGTFVPESGTVKFTASSVSIFGANNWYVFDCEVPGATIYFPQGTTQTINTGGTFKIIGSSGSPVLLTRAQATAVADLGWKITNSPTASLMWQINLIPGATVSLSNVQVAYSDARAHPIALPSNVTLMYYNGSGALSASVVTPTDLTYTYLTDYQWISGLPVVYSYTEDSDGDGKIDRIRVVTAAPINGDFSGFTASVTGYTIDTSKGTNGYTMVPSGSCLPYNPYPTPTSPTYGGYGYEFFIYLKELSVNDTGATPSWSIAKNTSLKDNSTDNFKVSTLNDLATTAIDGSKPRIAYTLALPGKNQVFFHFSEPIYASDGSSAVDSSYFSGASSISRVTTSGNGTSEVLATYPSSISAASIAAATLYLLSASTSNAIQSPIDYSSGSWLSFFFTNYLVTPPAPYNEAAGYSSTSPSWSTPATVASVPYYRSSYSSAEALGYEHRVSDVMISLPPPTSGTYDPTTYFAWPIYAKDNLTLTLSDSQIANLTAAQSAAEGIGLIRAFDGSQWLRPQTVTVQTRVSANLGSSYKPSLAYDTNVASTYWGSVSGTWLPKHAESSFSGLDAYPDSGSASQGSASSAATNLWNLSVPSTDSKISGVADNSVFGFFYTLSSSPSDLYVGRLAVSDPSTIPADWYRYVRPFSFYFHKIVQQKGGVTILNNVIDPTKGDSVRLDYQLATEGSVTVTVFTLDGDVVARLVDSSSQAAGNYSVYWNGKNLGGRPVARGLYFIRLVAPGMDEIRKVLVIRR
jgi:hypothetical protein